MPLPTLTLPGFRLANLLLLLFCGVAMAFALYLQHGMGLEPCNLCILQRVAMLATAAFLLIAVIHHPGPLQGRLYTSLALVSALTGVGLAGRHVWLQHLPADQVPACGPGLNYLLDVFPLQEALAMVLQASGECAQVSWRFLGFSLAEQTLVVFCFLSACLLFQLFRPRP